MPYSETLNPTPASFKKHRPEDGGAPKKINATVAKRKNPPQSERRTWKRAGFYGSGKTTGYPPVLFQLRGEDEL